MNKIELKTFNYSDCKQDELFNAISNTYPLGCILNLISSLPCLSRMHSRSVYRPFTVSWTVEVELSSHNSQNLSGQSYSITVQLPWIPFHYLWNWLCLENAPSTRGPDQKPNGAPLPQLTTSFKRFDLQNSGERLFPSRFLFKAWHYCIGWYAYMSYGYAEAKLPFIKHSKA